MYELEYVALVENNYITINRGDIIVGIEMDLNQIVVLRLINNQRYF